MLLVGDDHQRFEVAQIFVGPPVLGELDRGAHQLAVILLELPFQPLEQGEGVGGRAGEAADHRAVSPMRRTFFALGFITVLPIDTWPSPAMTVLPPFFTPEDRGSVPIFQSRLLWN